jgi:hypothetical protein
MRPFILLSILFVLTACGSSKFYRINTNSYEAVTMPVKNICFFVQDIGTKGKGYQKFEAYFREELGKRGVDVHFVYYLASDSLADQKFRDSVDKYQFDFIIKESMQGNTSGGTTIVTQGSPGTVTQPGIAGGPIFNTSSNVDMHFMGYRKKGKYQLVWKSSCENMRSTIFSTFPKKAGECLLNSLIAQKLIPEKALGEQ